MYINRSLLESKNQSLVHRSSGRVERSLLSTDKINKMPRLIAISALGLLAVLILAHSAYSVDVNEFLAQREQFLAEESSRILGGSITLNADEQLVNNMLMTAKTLEYDQSFSNLDFAPATNFFLAKPSMLQSEVFKFIQQMPKGKRLFSLTTCQSFFYYTQYALHRLLYIRTLYFTK